MPLDNMPWSDPEVKPLDMEGEILERAADLIERHGLSRGCFHHGESLCAVGALRVAAGFEIQPADVGKIIKQVMELRPYFHRLGFERGAEVYKWNDAPGRTAAEVIQRLRSAARRGPC